MMSVQFLVAAALLVVICGLALLWPVWRAAAREPAPLQARGLIVALAGFLLVVPALIHLGLGGANTLQRLAEQGAALSATQPGQPSPEQIVAMVDRLAERMKAQPDNVEGWMMLGRASYVLARYEAAADAYAKASRLQPANALLLIDEADALAMAQGQQLHGKPSELLQKALVLDPDNLKALALSGAAALERGEPAQAIAYWKRALKVVPAESEAARELQASIDQTRQSNATATASGAASGAQTVAPPQSVPGAARTDAKGSASVSGVVRLSEAVLAQTRPDDTVFVFARAVDGSRVPLALMRRTVADLPIKFTLDETMAMVPSARLVKGQSVLVGARISRSGLAAPQSGDIEGLSAAVPVGATGVQIVLERRLP